MGYLRAKIDLLRNRQFALSYWEPLWEKKTASYKEVYIQCWNEEKQQMAELLPHAANVVKEGLVHYFQIVLNDVNRQYLQKNSFENGKLKWFFVRFIEEDGTEGIEIRDYGAEVIFNHITTAEVKEVREILEKSKAKIEFLKDEEDEDEQSG